MSFSKNGIILNGQGASPYVSSDPNEYTLYVDQNNNKLSINNISYGSYELGEIGPTGAVGPTEWLCTMGSSGNEFFGTVSSGTFQAVRDFVFRGTDNTSSIVELIAVVSGNNASSEGEWRVYDLTNAQMIASATFLSGSNIILSSTTTISNLPTGPAVFEIQLRRISNGVRMHCLNIIF